MVVFEGDVTGITEGLTSQGDNLSILGHLLEETKIFFHGFMEYHGSDCIFLISYTVLC